MLSVSRSALVQPSAKPRHAATVAGLATATAAAIPAVDAGEQHTIQVGLIGCGGRGTGAAANALCVPQPGIISDREY